MDLEMIFFLPGNGVQVLECVPRCMRHPPIPAKAQFRDINMSLQHIKSKTSLGYKVSCLKKTIILIKNLQIQKDFLRDQHHGMDEEWQGRVPGLKFLI